MKVGGGAISKARPRQAVQVWNQNDNGGILLEKVHFWNLGTQEIDGRQGDHIRRTRAVDEHIGDTLRPSALELGEEQILSVPRTERSQKGHFVSIRIVPGIIASESSGSESPPNQLLLERERERERGSRRILDVPKCKRVQVSVEAQIDFAAVSSRLLQHRRWAGSAPTIKGSNCMDSSDGGSGSSGSSSSSRIGSSERCSAQLRQGRSSDREFCKWMSEQVQKSGLVRDSRDRSVVVEGIQRSRLDGAHLHEAEVAQTDAPHVRLRILDRKR
ncbi:hypothetical protein AXG93_402s1220 [Marchantia polymorpha subsp. ruderalis]|uniref:Uncharacterized protein n=1 Tax=Marchantia polymorpha subsp. ruderalis TaxID=1480154 RepID=A0A176WC95_MARPO|nr:hypothetical protein AXG93_402s1220 [Marchantia polymorpha subsp. ruderalis]